MKKTYTLFYWCTQITVVKAIKGLEEKNLLKKEIRITKKGQSSNLYILYDFECIWEANNIDQVSEIVDVETKRKKLYKLARELNYTVKEKEPGTTGPSQATVEPSQKNNQPDVDYLTPKFGESQAPTERYSLEDIRTFYDYEAMVHDHPFDKTNIDAVINILYDVLNTTKKTIRINGEDKPANVVIGKFMKLGYYEIFYSLQKYNEQTDRINNPEAYLLTILYKSKEQMKLDIENQVHHDMANWNNFT